MLKISKIELGLIATFITVGLLGAYAALAVLPVPLVIP
jgi:Flp pilus assembly pilin Flp